jgi:spore coat protein U-like protein
MLVECLTKAYKGLVNMRTALPLLLLCLLTLAWPVARAEAFKCDVTATSLNFGSYDIFSPTPLDSTASINVTCNIPSRNPQAPMTVTVSLSTCSSGSFAQRWMQAGGPDNLNYNLYTNASFSTIWGDGGGSSSTQTGFVSKASPWNATIYGRIPALQNVSTGNYGDTITVTIDF